MNEMALDCCNNEIFVEIVLLQKSLFVYYFIFVRLDGVFVQVLHKDEAD